MTIAVEWDNPEHTVVRLDVPEGWTWDDISEANKQFIRLAQTVPHVVCTIIDLSHTHHLSKNFFSHIQGYIPSGQ